MVSSVAQEADDGRRVTEAGENGKEQSVSEPRIARQCEGSCSRSSRAEVGRQGDRSRKILLDRNCPRHILLPFIASRLAFPSLFCSFPVTTSSLGYLAEVNPKPREQCRAAFLQSSLYVDAHLSKSQRWQSDESHERRGQISPCALERSDSVDGYSSKRKAVCLCMYEVATKSTTVSASFCRPHTLSDWLVSPRRHKRAQGIARGSRGEKRRRPVRGGSSSARHTFA